MRAEPGRAFSWSLDGVILLIVMFLISSVAYGQGSAGALLMGTTTDDTGGVLPGVIVTVRNQRTGVEKVAVTDKEGRYRVPLLSPGSYDLTAELSGFEKIVETAYVLVLGQEAIVDFKLKVQGVQASVTVTGVSPQVDTTKSEVSTGVSELQIQALPVNTRQWINLANLTPGVSQDNIRADWNNVNVGGGTLWYANAFLMDGLSNNWAEMGEPRQNFAMDAIAEFKVSEGLFKAESGLATGGVVTAITKSGSNTFGGSAFLYDRNKALNSQGFFERNKPDYKRYQYGGTFGGPIVKNRTHFFFSLERTQETPFYTVNTGGAFPSVEGTFPAHNFDHMESLRFDHKISDTQSLAVRWAHEKDGKLEGAGGTVIPGSFHQAPRTSVVTTHSWTPSQHVLNELRMQYAAAAYQIWPGDCNTEYTQNGNWTADRFACQAEQVIVRPSLTQGYGWGDVGPETRVQLKDDLTRYVSGWGGEHTLKMGVDYSWVDFKEDYSGPSAKGTYSFSTNRPYNAADPSTYPFLFSATAPAQLLLAAQTGQFPVTENTELKTQYYAAYVQDDWKATSRLTLNLGLRYDLQLGVWNKDLTAAVSPFSQPATRGDNDNFGPRAGFVWDVLGDRRTLVRGGYGRYFDNVRTLVMFDERRNFHYIVVNISNPGYPDPFGGRGILSFASTSPPSITVNANDLQNPKADQFGLGISRQLAEDLAVKADFLYNDTSALWISTDLNYFATLADAVKGVRPNRSFARITQHGPGGWSRYKALMVSVDKRFSHRYQFLASYTLSKVTDNNPDSFAADQNNPAAEVGYGNTDRRHRLVLSGIVALPYRIQLSAVADLRSDLPFNVTAGKDLNFDTIGGDRPPGVTRNQGCRGLDLAAANAYRTASGLPAVADTACVGYASVDFRVSRRFAVGGNRNVEVLVQAFNALNRVNFNPSGFVGNALSPSFGQLLTALPARQVELAARFGF